MELEHRNLQILARLGDVYDEMGRHADALASFEKIRTFSGRLPNDYAARLARVYARMDRRDEAKQVLETLKDGGNLPVISAAAAYAALGDRDTAFNLLFRIVEDRSKLVIFIKQDPPFDSLH